MIRNFTKYGAVIAVAGLLCAGILSADKDSPVSEYISPNNDGIQDTLSVNFKVKDKSKIMGWALVIEDANGKVVRTIGNKVALPAKFSGKNLAKTIFSKKQSVEVPPAVVWNGVMDNGETAPDGEYFYYITAEDERGNKNSAKKKSVIVDNTPPSVELSSLPEGQRIFGEGDKPVFEIKQSGSVEDKWIGTIRNTSGKTVRNYTWTDSAPQNFTWNGTDDKGIIVADGIYTYEITATDRAGNKNSPALVSNIIFSAEKPETNVYIVGTRYFSIPSKSSLASVTLAISIPEPRENSGNALVSWSLEILSADGAIVRSYKGGKDEKPGKQIVFDGKNDSGSQIADGEYFARVNAEYLNGYKTPEVKSTTFVFDTTSPSAKIVSYDDVFSPDGDGNKDFFTLKQAAGERSFAPVRNWTGKIFRAGTSDAVYEYNFGSSLPAQISWNGLDMNGALCSDGGYDYEISAADMAGNSFSVKTEKAFSLDTSKTEVMLVANYSAFNPSGARKTLTYTSVLKSSAVKSYSFEIKNKSGVSVYSQKGSGKVPAKFVWNGNSSAGKLCDDGLYFASIEIESQNGSGARADASPVEIDTAAPYVDASLEYTVFSPENDSRKDTLKVAANNSSAEDEWTAEILDGKGKTVKVFEWNGKLTSFEWDGCMDDGNRAADGTYSMVIRAADKAGNEFNKKFDSIVVDTRPTNAYVTATLPGFSPDSLSGLTRQKFDVRLSLNEEIESWSFDIVDMNDKKLFSFDNKAAVVPSNFVWDGKNADGKVLEGSFAGRLTVDYKKGNLVDTKTSAFICSVTPPALTVSTAPEFFSPDNDGVDDDCFINLSGKASNGAKLVRWSFVINNPESSGNKKAFWTTAGTDRITPTITWDGLSNTSQEKNGLAERVQSAMDYPYVFTVTDSLGLTSAKTGIIPVDILVIRDGSALKMAVPSIIFRSNHADFKTAREAAGSQVTEAQAANNVRVLKRVAEILKKFPDYTVTVVGHANKTGAKGEEETLFRLSGLRADFVKTRLTEYGIPAARLSSEGKGATQPVAAFEDTASWWKNRRVEFILHK